MDSGKFWWQAADAPPAGIGNSLRFRGGTENLRNTFTTTYNTKLFTLSCWVKLSGTQSGVFEWAAPGGTGPMPQGNNSTTLYFNHTPSNSASHIGRYYNSGITISQWSATSNRILRDPSAWYHYVLQRTNDGVNSVPVYKLWINGVEATMPSGNLPNDSFGAADSFISIGAFINGAGNMQAMGEMYLADLHYISDQNVAPTDFGEYDANGVWVPKEVNLSQAQYGTNGFYLDFSDPADIGADRSGNGNDFTPTGFDFDSNTNYFSGSDLTPDSPTNNRLTDYNRLTAGAVSVVPGTTENNWFWQKSQQTWNQQQIAQGVLPTSGKWWFEWGCVFAGGNTDVATGFQTLANARTTYVSTFPGWTDNGYGWYNPTTYSALSTWHHSGVATDIAPHILLGNGDRYKLGFAVDCDQATPTVQLWQNVVNDFDDTAGWAKVGDVTLDRADVEAGLVAVTSIYAANTGQRFESTNPTIDAAGYKVLTSNVLPAAPIADGSDHFRAITDTGANILTAAQTAFPNGLWWIKDRANANVHQLMDSVRGGASASINCPGDTSEAAYVAPSGDSVAWCWKTNGPATTNNDGNVESQVSANPDAGFSIVTWTGAYPPGNSFPDPNRVGHGLTKTPEFIIYKSRNFSGADGYFYCHFESLTPGDWMYNYLGYGSSAVALRADQTPDATTITNFGYATTGPLPAQEVVAYCWHSVPGYSKIGTYVGISSADGPFIYTGFRPAWLMRKRVSGGTGSWVIFDSTRDIANPTNIGLITNQALREDVEPAWSVDFLSNGFKVRSTNPDVNTAGDPYIYCCFAENPFGGSNVSPANAR